MGQDAKLCLRQEEIEHGYGRYVTRHPVTVF